jgi:hypothetical protein
VRRPTSPARRSPLRPVRFRPTANLRGEKKGRHNSEKKAKRRKKLTLVCSLMLAVPPHYNRDTSSHKLLDYNAVADRDYGAPGQPPKIKTGDMYAKYQHTWKDSESVKRTVELQIEHGLDAKALASRLRTQGQSKRVRTPDCRSGLALRNPLDVGSM